MTFLKADQIVGPFKVGQRPTHNGIQARVIAVEPYVTRKTKRPTELATMKTRCCDCRTFFTFKVVSEADYPVARYMSKRCPTCRTGKLCVPASEEARKKKATAEYLWHSR